MTRLMIELPEDLDAKLRARAMDAGYTNPQEYVRALIAADANESEQVDFGAPAQLTFHTKAELEAMLLEGLASGPAEEVTTSEWAEMRQQLRERHTRPEST